jgi:hydantoinase/carbamoylase family amidase
VSSAIRIDAARLRRRLEELSHIGRTPARGVTRLSYSPEHAEAVRLVAEWLRLAGAQVGIDSWGNLHGLVPGTEDGLPAVSAGSHLDTVPNGGIFDGALGVVAAVEAAAALRDAAVRARRSLLLLAFAEEEGTSFAVGCLGSLGAIGQAPPPHTLRDPAGITAAERLQQFNAGIAVTPAPLPAAAYLELHIEQGPVLARTGASLAAVGSIVGVTSTGVEFTGEANHAGTTPMDARRDALWGAADFIAEVRTLAQSTGGRAVGTVGQVAISPGATNVVPGHAALSIELRSADSGLLETLRENVAAAAASCAQRYSLGHAVGRWHTDLPVRLDDRLHSEILYAAADLGWEITTLPSWAEHDAKILAWVMPTGMIFVPSDDGISHSPHERTSWDDVARGAQLLCRALQRLMD